MRRFIRARRASALTDYGRRIALLKSNLPRVVVRKSNRNIVAQIVRYEPTGDKVVVTARSSELAAMGWPVHSNTPTAYLTGMMLAKRAKGMSEELVLDTGLYKPTKSSIIFAAAKGAIDGGLKIKGNIQFDEKRITGSHIVAYADSIKSDSARYSKQFSGYLKVKADPTAIAARFDEVKKKISS
ncbi:MAG: 50S ribosomal protein L18 [Candidatus Micrarchaeota archaeon]|nr:50S ribosomal protein L18 [Candidatus Micrarchaeota archaeon]